jgi:hypothetical protein
VGGCKFPCLKVSALVAGHQEELQSGRQHRHARDGAPSGRRRHRALLRRASDAGRTTEAARAMLSGVIKG